MKKSEIFQIVLDVVCGCTEVAAADVLSDKRTEEVVTARCLIVVFGRDYGLCNNQLTRFLRFRSHNSVRYLIDKYDRCRTSDRSFRSTADYAAHELDKTMLAMRQ